VSYPSIISALAMGGTFGLLTITSDRSAIAASFISSVVLFAFIQFIEMKKVDELEAIDQKINALKEKIDTVLLKKGFGR
jgi:uncharacterized membrane protein YdjX (TVP38/TMEM64 family)